MARMTKRRVVNRQRVKSHLLSHPCVDCGENDPCVLQFDHVRGRKRGTISELAKGPWEVVEREIGKCQVRCANCHIRRHYREKLARDGQNN